MDTISCRITPFGIAVDGHGLFDLNQIMESGQCFRLTKRLDGDFVAVIGQRYVEISPVDATGYLFRCDWDEFWEVWTPYFDLSTDYGAFQRKMAGDSFLEDAIAVGGGIRILRQDLWETVVSFVISQRNNIPRIRSSVDTLCRTYGTLLNPAGSDSIYSFPTPEQLRGKDLSCTSLGYREKYVQALIKQPENVWRLIARQDDETAKETLLRMSGIGEKVASCVMLYGLHRMDSYPRDVWINRLIDDVYGGSFDPGKYPGFAGYVQQLQFYHYRRMAKEGST